MTDLDNCDQVSSSESPPFVSGFGLVFPFLGMLLLILAVNWCVQLYPDNDDAYYLELVHQKSFTEFMAFRYSNWTGRVFSEVLHYVIFSRTITFWKFLNTGFAGLLAFSMALLLLGWGFWRKLDRNTLLVICLICFGLGWISQPVLV